MEKRKELIEIHWMRGLAALSIMLYHYTSRYGDTIGHVADWPVMVPFGCGAVNTFFLLTGFLTAYTMKDVTPTLFFLKKRAKRLYPTYWACIAVTTLCMVTFFPRYARSWQEVLVNLTMLQGFVGVPAVDGVYWTLTFELMFYFLVGAVLLINGDRRKHLYWFALLWITVSLSFTFAKDALGISYPPVDKLLMIQFCAPFAGGILIKAIWDDSRGRLAWAGIAGAFALSYLVQAHDYFLYFAICAAALIAVGGGKFIRRVSEDYQADATNAETLAVCSQDKLSTISAPSVHRLGHYLASGEKRTDR